MSGRPNRLRALLLPLAFAAAFTLCAAARAEETLRGVALVIGQSKYEHIAALPNPANDAREVAKLLTDMGFDARSVSDRDAGRLRRDLERFVEDAEEADVAVLYYSGHGIEAGGENYLLPVDVDVSSLSNANEDLVALSQVMDELKATVPVTILLLDACRTNPFPVDAVVRKQPKASAEPVSGGGLAVVRGAAPLSSGTPAAENLGTVIGFAAEPGRPALDGDAGGNSPYAAALVRHLGAMPGAEFGAVMRMVTEEVYLDTKGAQRPWVNESLRRLLYFGVAAEEPTGDEGLITGERRQLLLTISDLADANRAQVEMAAAKDGVPLDSLYGVLRALGTEKIPEDPNELGKMLDAQAERLKKMFAERDALKTDDPEMKRLASAADLAIREGAIQTARQFLDQAVARVEETASQVDQIEEELKQKRLADAAIYARRAEASSLAFDYRAAATDYARAYELAQKWDEDLSWNYKNLEAEALAAHGSATGERESLNRAIAAYRTLLDMVPYGERNSEWAITRNNMAVVLQTIGERSADSARLEEAVAIFRESLAFFAESGEDANWAAAQNNIGSILLELGERSGDRAMLEQAVEAFSAARAKRDRAKVPLDWAASQNNVGIALYALADRETGPERLKEAEAAYRAALEVYTREAAPVQWAMVQNNLGNTLNSLGAFQGTRDAYDAAADAFRAALEVRTRETFPLSWATSRLNLGNALSNSTKFDFGTSVLEEAAAAYSDALEIYTRDDFPVDWAAVQNNLGHIYLTLGQRTQDLTRLQAAADAFRSSEQVYLRDKFPLDWAMARYNLGNALQFTAGLSGDLAKYREAIAAYRDALGEYKRETAPRQWAMAQAAIASTLHWLSLHDSDEQILLDSITARRSALEVMKRENAPVDWANAQNGLGMSLLNLSTRRQDPAPLDEAAAAFEASLEVFSRSEQPMQWAFGQNNIGDIYWNRAVMGGGRADFERAIEYFEAAKQGFQESGYTVPIPLTDQKIDAIRQMMPAK